MERIATPTAEADLHGAGKDGFRDGEGFPAEEPTALNAAWFNDVQEEICNVIETLGYALNPADRTQLYTAITTLSLVRGTLAAKLASAMTALMHDEAVGGGYSESNDIWCGVRSKSSNNTMHAVIAGEAGTIWTVNNSEAWTERTAAGSYADSFRCAATNTVEGAASGLVLLAGEGGEIQTAPYNDPATWTQRTAAGGFAGTFYGATFSSGLFVLVGTGGTIQTSPDGVTWTARTAAGGFVGTWRSVVRSAGLYIAVGASGTIQTSPDGTTWTARTSGTTDEFLSIVDLSSVVVALTVAGDLYYSADGITWTETAIPQPLSTQANALFYDRSRLYVLADSGRVAVCTDFIVGDWERYSMQSSSGASIHVAVPIGHRNQSVDLMPVKLAFFGELGQDTKTAEFF